MGIGDHLPGGAVEEVDIAGNRHRLVGDADGGCIGRVDPGEPALVVAQPDGHRRRGERGAHRLDLGRDQLVADLHLGERQPVAGEIAKTHHRRAAGGPPLRFQQPAAGRGNRQGERLAAFAQPRDGAIDPRRRIRLQPCAESEEAGPVERRSPLRQAPGDQRRLAGRAPGDQALILAGEQRLGPVGGRLEVGDLGAELGILVLGPVPGAQRSDRAPHRKAHRPDKGGKENDLDWAGIAEDELLMNRRRGRGGEEEDRQSEDEADPAIPNRSASPSCLRMQQAPPRCPRPRLE